MASFCFAECESIKRGNIGSLWQWASLKNYGSNPSFRSIEKALRHPIPSLLDTSSWPQLRAPRELSKSRESARGDPRGPAGAAAAPGGDRHRPRLRHGPGAPGLLLRTPASPEPPLSALDLDNSQGLRWPEPFEIPFSRSGLFRTQLRPSLILLHLKHQEDVICCRTK